MRKAVFLDRDGTLNFDPGYLSDPEQLQLLPRVAEALWSLKEAGFFLVVVTNQSGVGRGLIERPQLLQIHERMEELLRSEIEELGYRLAPGKKMIDAYYWCEHRPQDACECRKPSPKMLEDASKKLDLDLSFSFMVGDSKSDLGAGRAAGVQAVALVRSGKGHGVEKSLKDTEVDFVGDDLFEVTQWLLRKDLGEK